MTTAQSRAVKSYRERLAQNAMARFEVIALDADRELIRKLAKRLATRGPEAERLRAAVRSQIGGGTVAKGGIAAALRASPLVGADLDLERPVVDERALDL